MLAGSDVIAFVAIVDLERARRFYEETLGLTVVEQSPFACVVDANGTMLRMTPIPELTTAPYTVLGWRVNDISLEVADLAARGVTFLRYEGMEQDDVGVWTVPGGDQVAWFQDPDGNTLSLTQFAPSP